MTSPEAKFWQKARDNSDRQESNLDSCQAPANCNIIGTKWVFKKKGPDMFRARLVVKEFKQVEGVDYIDTFAPVVRFSTLRILFAAAVRYNFEIHHCDISSAFLHGELRKDVYISQPEGYVQPGKEIFVCKLRKALYGLKQGGNVWNARLHEFMISMNLVQSRSDQCVYYYADEHGNMLIVAVFVDDITLFSNTIKFVNQFKDGIQKKFSTKDLGEIRTICGINVTQDREKGIIRLDQKDYIDQILQRYDFAECNECDTPMVPGTALNHDDSKPAAPDVPYQNVIGSILYLTQTFRPDLSYCVSTLSRYNQKYKSHHWDLVKRVLRYLKGSSNACTLNFVDPKNSKLRFAATRVTAVRRMASQSRAT